MMRGDLLTRVISSESEKSFSFAVMKGCGDSGISAPKPSPRGEGGERSEPDRAGAV